jgi:DNA repair exonuclease SbcCD ATPase subunit
LERYSNELKRLESTYDQHFNTLLNLITTEQHTLTERFFDTIARRAVEVFEAANRRTEQWLRAAMAPVDRQIREHQMQYKRRLDSMRRIQKATETLEERVLELKQSRAELDGRLQELDAMRREVQTRIRIAAGHAQEAAVAAAGSTAHAVAASFT